MNVLKKSILVVTLCALFSCLASADEIHMLDGRVFNGKPVRSGDETLIYKSTNSYLAVASREISKIVPQECPFQEYERRYQEINKKDIQALAMLAAFCKKYRLNDERDNLYKRIVRVDPNHAQARAALGYENIRGNWYRGKDLEYIKSLTFYDGRWLTKPEYRVLMKQKIKQLDQEDATESKRYEDTRIEAHQKTSADRAEQLPPMESMPKRTRSITIKSYSDRVVTRTPHVFNTGTNYGLPQTPFKKNRNLGQPNKRNVLQNVKNIYNPGGFGTRQKSPIMITTETPFVSPSHTQTRGFGINLSFGRNAKGKYRVRIKATGRNTDQRATSVTSPRLTQFVGFR